MNNLQSLLKRAKHHIVIEPLASSGSHRCTNSTKNEAYQQGYHYARTGEESIICRFGHSDNQCAFVLGVLDAEGDEIIELLYG